MLKYSIRPNWQVQTWDKCSAAKKISKHKITDRSVYNIIFIAQNQTYHSAPLTK